MHRRVIGSFGAGLIALALAAAPLAGCSSANIGASTWGNSKLEVAEVKNIGGYTPELALTEARAHFRNNDFGHSAAFYKRVVELQPKNPEGYVGLAASYDRLRRFDLSDRVYKALFDLSGASAQYYNNVGYSYMLRGNFKAAYTSFRNAEKLDPNNVVISNNLQILADAAAAARA
jgi:Flp pilus assembly protein TadD